MRTVAVGQKLLLCHVVLVLMNRSLPPEGRDTKRSLRDGRLQPITFSVGRIIHCSLPLSVTVAAEYQMVMEEVIMDSVMMV